MSPWFALVGPADVPREIVTRLNGIVAAALKSPDVLQRLTTLGYEPLGGTPGELAATIKTDIAKYAKVIRSAGIKVEK